ncbi:hypothetical protein LY76DRAFT_211117 [Colletotrichum caudatum]|nr:hypothetical protein LY76DRAFT_211117 [Colletotrichum caudatum]
MVLIHKVSPSPSSKRRRHHHHHHHHHRGFYPPYLYLYLPLPPGGRTIHGTDGREVLHLYLCTRGRGEGALYGTHTHGAVGGRWATALTKRTVLASRPAVLTPFLSPFPQRSGSGWEGRESVKHGRGGVWRLGEGYKGGCGRVGLWFFFFFFSTEPTAGKGTRLGWASRSRMPIDAWMKRPCSRVRVKQSVCCERVCGRVGVVGTSRVTGSQPNTTQQVVRASVWDAAGSPDARLAAASFYRRGTGRAGVGHLGLVGEKKGEEGGVSWMGGCRRVGTR